MQQRGGPAAATMRVVRLAEGAIVAQVLFVVGWVVIGALEGRGYSPGRHDISDLSALTARYPWVILAVEGVAGVLTIAFAIGALRPAMFVPGFRAPIGPWLVALSLPGLDNLSDLFFRLDCRAADAGCTASRAAASWHGTTHVVMATVAGVATLIAPFALAHRMRLLDAWRDLARPAQVFGAISIVGVLAYTALENKAGAGWAQRALAIWVPAGIVVLAARVRRLALSRRTEANVPPPVAVT
jgi:Protein of unknown function (DUF998)